MVELGLAISIASMAKSSLMKARNRISQPKNISMCPSIRTLVDDASAEGPAIQDAGLARFLRAAQLGTPEEAGSVAEVQRAVQDCVELGLFSAYQLEAREALARYAQEPMFEDEIRAAVVEDIRRIYAGMREQLALYDFSVLYGLPAPLLISETPFIDWRVRATSGASVCIASAGTLLPAGRRAVGEEKPNRPGGLEGR